MRKNIIVRCVIVLGMVAMGIVSSNNVLASSKVNDYIHANKLKPSKVTSAVWNGFPTSGMGYRHGKPEGVVVHETANASSTIFGEIAFMKNNYNNAFVHSFIDDNHIINIAKTNLMSWGSGGMGNGRYIQFEQTRVHSKKAFAREANNAAYYVAYLLNQYGLEPSLATTSNHGSNATVWSHHDVSNYLGGTDHADPTQYYNDSGKVWFNDSYTMADLYSLIKEYYKKMNYDTVKYVGAEGSETVKVNNSGYYLYSHVSNTKGAKREAKASTLAGKTLYLDCTGEKNKVGTKWYRVRVKGTSKKYWVYSGALSFRKVAYTDMNTTGTIKPAVQYNMHTHTYNSKYLSKVNGNTKAHANQTVKIDGRSITTDYNGSKTTMYRIVMGKTNYWVYSNAIAKRVNDQVTTYGADGSESATVNSNKYALYQSVKDTTDNNVSLGASTELTGKKVKLLKRSVKKVEGTTWYQVASGSKKYWVYSKALTFPIKVSYKDVNMSATVSNKHAYNLHNHVYNSAYLSLTTGHSNDSNIKGKPVTIDTVASINQIGKGMTSMYRFRVVGNNTTYWAYPSALTNVVNH